MPAADAEGRCRALLLWCNLVFAVLLPLILLVPLRHASAATLSGEGQPLGMLAAAERGMESCLRPLMWPSLARRTRGQAGEAAGARRRVAGVAQLPGSKVLGPLVLRWWAVCAMLWSVCCALEGS